MSPEDEQPCEVEQPQHRTQNYLSQMIKEIGNINELLWELHVSIMPLTGNTPPPGEPSLREESMRHETLDNKSIHGQAENILSMLANTQRGLNMAIIHLNRHL